MIDDDTLSAYLDDELSPAEMTKVNSAIAGDELLAARLKQFERVDRLVAEFCSDIDKNPLPSGVEALVQDSRGAARSESLKPRAKALFGATFQHWPGFVLAASTVVAVLVVLRIDLDGGKTIDFDGLAGVGPIAVSSPLYRALEGIPSDIPYLAASSPEVAITPVLSFVSTRAEVCREFRLDAGPRVARGLACRRDGRWATLKVGIGTPSAGAGNYEPALSRSDPQFDAFVDKLMSTAPMDRWVEARLLNNGWREVQAGAGNTHE